MSIGMRLGRAGDIAEASPGRAWPRWSMGHWAVVAAALLAFVANLVFLRTRDDAVAVVVAARPIEAGAPVAEEDLTTTLLRADPGVLATLHTSADGLAGRVARRSIDGGELVGAADLLSGPAPDGLVSMSIPIEPAHAAGGVVRVGDRVDVVDVDEEGSAGYVVRDVPVLAAAEFPTGALSVTGQQHLVLGVRHGKVLALAEAIADGDVDVVVTTGSVDG